MKSNNSKKLILHKRTPRWQEAHKLRLNLLTLIRDNRNAKGIYKYSHAVAAKICECTSRNIGHTERMLCFLGFIWETTSVMTAHGNTISEVQITPKGLLYLDLTDDLSTTVRKAALETRGTLFPSQKVGNVSTKPMYYVYSRVEGRGLRVVHATQRVEGTAKSENKSALDMAKLAGTYWGSRD